MRTSLLIIVVFYGTRCLFAGQLPPLTAAEISLMLRSGYSSEAVLSDLSARHFASKLDPAAEKQLREANASPTLLNALKNGENAASEEELAELAQAHQRIAEGKIAAQQAATQQRAYFQREQASIAARQQAAAKTAQMTQQEPKSDYESLAVRGFGSDTSTNAVRRPTISDESLLPSERAALKTYEMLTLSEINALTPSERVAANAAKRAAKDAEDRAAYEAWCETHPKECAAQIAGAAAQAQADRQREQARAEEEDRQRARRVVDQMETNLFMGHSAEQLKTDLFMAKGQGGPETRRVINQMETNLFMGHSTEQLKTDLFMLKH